MAAGAAVALAPVTASGQTSAPLHQAAAAAAGLTALPVLRSPGYGAGGPVAGEAMLTNGAGQGMPAAAEAARPPAEPAAPSEFQRYVFRATGQALGNFGHEFFGRNAPRFAPVAQAPAPASYVIGPGDELRVRGWGTVDIDLRLVVDRDGQVVIPRVGTVRVAGLRVGEAESTLRERVGRVYRGFNLDVTLGALRSIQIYVVGHASAPGTHTVSSLSTLVTAVFASGGPSPNGSLRQVILRRNNVAIAQVDLYDFLVNGAALLDVPLQAGDVIVYPPVGPRVAVMGAVDTPAIYELRPFGSALSEIAGLAGARRAHVNASVAQLERIDPANPRAPRVVAKVSLAQADQVQLRDGDLLTLQPVAPQFSNAVTLRGNVAEALRHPHTPGMRISDLIPERDALITRDYFIRKNRLVQYLDPLPAADAQAAASPRDPFNPSAEDRLRRLLTEDQRLPAETRDTLRRAEQSMRNLVDEPNWEYATIERLDTDRISTVLLPFNLGRAVLQRDPAHNLELLPGDVVTIFGSRDLRVPQARTSRLVRVEGEVERPGVYQLQAGDTLHTLLARAGGITPQAYLFGTEFSRESTRQRQRVALDDAIRRLEASLGSAGAGQIANLGTADAATAARLQAAEQQARQAQLQRLRALRPNGRIALELEPSIRRVGDLPDIPLEDGDAVLVPARPGFVFAVGAVANENALLWRPGRTVKGYLAQAGLLADADEGNLFVARADGSIVHARERSAGFFGGSRLDSLQLAPGDTIVVPDRLDRESPWSAFVRGAKDWTQILSNFGLAAAAIKTLRN